MRRRGSNDAAMVFVILFAVVLVGALIALTTSSFGNAPKGQYTYLITTKGTGAAKTYYSWSNASRLTFGGPKNMGGANGLNFTAVIQATFDSLQCGNVALAPQVFNDTHGFKMYPCDSLTAQARAGDFSTNPNSATIWNTNCSRPAITLEVNPSFPKYQVFPEIAHVTISSTGSCASTQDGLFVNEANGAILDITLSYDAFFALGGNCINAGTTNAHFWIDNTYLEDCHQNGITGKGNIFISNSYIFGNSLYGVNHITGSGFNSFHDFYINNVQSAIFCANINNQCTSQDDVIQNNGGPSYAQFSVATSNSPTANPTLISGDVFTDSRTSGFAPEAINFEATLVNSQVSTDYFYSAKSITCFNVLAGGYIAGGSLSNVIITGNQGCNMIGKVTAQFTIGGTSATTKHFIGPLGMNATTVVASQPYTAAIMNQYVSCSGGSGVNISILDSMGNTAETLGACPSTVIDLPIGWAINFGAFSVAPTVVDYVKSI